MRKGLTFRQYRQMDLAVFAAMLLVCESVIVMAATRWFPAEPYTVSASAAVTAIVMMRWGPWAGIHALAAGLLYCFLSGGTARQLFIYGGGNLLSLAGMLYLKGFGKERVREDSVLTVAFGLTVQLLMQLGRAVMALLLGASGTSVLGFFTTDALSLLFTGVILWIARRQDGLFEDQKHYLLRIQKQEKEE